MSVLEILEKWFSPVVKDYRPGDIADFPEYCAKKYDISKIPPTGIIASHFELDGNHLHQRYPELLEGDGHTIFTIFRDPLELRISLYYYMQRAINPPPQITLLEALARKENYLSERIPCTEDNYREMLSRYHFIGIMEYLQESFDVLAKLLDKPSVVIPHANKSSREDYLLTEEFVADFKARNRLDYLIYEYAKDRFLQTLIKMNRS